MKRTGCAVATAYTAEEFAWLESLEFGADEVERLAWCELEPGHEGDWHYAEAQGVMEGQWWLRWNGTGEREFQMHQWFPVTDPAYVDTLAGGEKEELEPCCLFEGHPGRHGYEFDISEDAFGLRRPHLSVGHLREALACLPDDMPLRFAADQSNVLSDDSEIIAIGFGLGRLMLRDTHRPFTVLVDTAVLIIGKPPPTFPHAQPLPASHHSWAS